MRYKQLEVTDKGGVYLAELPEYVYENVYTLRTFRNNHVVMNNETNVIVKKRDVPPIMTTHLVPHKDYVLTFSTKNLMMAYIHTDHDPFYVTPFNKWFPYDFSVWGIFIVLCNT